MRLTLRSTVLAVVVVATALTAPSAVAQNEPLAHNQSPGTVATVEPGGTPCPAVTPSPAPAPGPTSTAGGCRVHFSGPNIVLVAHVFGIESVDSTCNWEFDVRFDSVGEGFFAHLELNQGTQGTCTRRPCGSSASIEGRASSLQVLSWFFPPQVRILVFLLCLENHGGGSPPTHCEVSATLTEPTNHRYRIGTNDSACHGVAGFRGEFTGTWNTETTLGTTGEAQAEQQVELNAAGS